MWTSSNIIFYRHKVFPSWHHSTNVIAFIKSLYKTLNSHGQCSSFFWIGELRIPCSETNCFTLIACRSDVPNTLLSFLRPQDFGTSERSWNFSCLLLETLNFSTIWSSTSLYTCGALSEHLREFDAIDNRTKYALQCRNYTWEALKNFCSW